MFKKKLLFIPLLIMCSFANIHGKIERRAAFDLGSGSLKLLIADVDSNTHHIVNYVFSKNINVPLSDDLAKNGDKQFCEEIQQRVKQAIHELKLVAEEFGAERYFGVATEAFRLAKNGEKLIFQLARDEGFTIRLINQKEEAELGFATAVAHSKSNPENAVVWDIGNGSFQISWKDNHRITSYVKQLGKTPVKNLIISEIQGKLLSKEFTPNPISSDQANLAKSLLIKELGEIPNSLQIKIHDPATEVYGVGAIHNGNISISSKKMKYTQDVVAALLAERIGLSDSSFDVEAPEFWVSDLIFVSAVMSHLNISSVTNIKSFDVPNVVTSGSTIGILVWPEYWQRKAFDKSSLNSFEEPIMNTNIYIVKGGETAQTGQVWHGAGTNSSLTEQGEKSSATLQSKVASWNITAAYTSPQKRIIESAKIALKDSDIIAAVNENLGPRKITPFEGMAGDDVKALYRKYHGLDSQHKITSDGVFSKEWGSWESGAFEINDSLRARIKNFTEMVLDSHQGQSVFVQTHVDWIREAYRLFTGAPDTEDYAVSTKTVLLLKFNENRELVAVEREEMPNR